MPRCVHPLRGRGEGTSRYDTSQGWSNNDSHRFCGLGCLSRRVWSAFPNISRKFHCEEHCNTGEAYAAEVRLLQGPRHLVHHHGETERSDRVFEKANKRSVLFLAVIQQVEIHIRGPSQVLHTPESIEPPPLLESESFSVLLESDSGAGPGRMVTSDEPTNHGWFRRSDTLGRCSGSNTRIC